MKQTIIITAICLLSVTAHAREAKLPANKSAPRYFIENKGQVHDQNGHGRSDVQYVLHGQGGMNIFVGSGAMHYQFCATQHKAMPHDIQKKEADTTNTYRVDMALEGANPLATAQVTGEAGYYERYYTPGCDGVVAHAYSCITYSNVYPGIDWIIKLQDGAPAYEFLVRPGGNVADIKLSYSGATAITKGADGSLQITTPMGQVREQAPVCYQGDGSSVASAFIIAGNEVSFAVAPYSGSLLVDPALQWATYYGGTDGGLEYFSGVACDDSAYIYACGLTTSADNIATTGGFQNSFGGSTDAFFVKFDSTGSRKWATYYGGASDDGAASIASSKAGMLYVVGYVSHPGPGLATAGSFQPLPSGGISGFLAKFGADGIRVWATYYGIDSSTRCRAVCLDATEHVYISGSTSDIINISTSGAYQSYRSGVYDVFLAKFDSSGTREWGTYYGGPIVEQSYALCTDSTGNVYMVGSTTSQTGIASPGCFQPAYGGGQEDGFIAKFSGTGACQWSTYYGGSAYEYCTGIACYGNSVFVSGTTHSASGIATAGSYQSTLGGLEDIFLAKFSAAGIRQWATYLGGAGYDNNAGFAGNSMSCDKNGDLYLTGGVGSTGLASATGAYQKTYGGGLNDALFAKFDTSGNLFWATYFGGCGSDVSNCSVVDNTGHIYMAGYTQSTESIATAGSFYPSLDGSVDAFLARFSDTPTPGIVGDTILCPFASATYAMAPVNGALFYTWVLPVGWSGSSTTDTISITAGTASGSIGIVTTKICTTDTTWLFIHVPSAPVITLSGNVFTTTIPFVSYQWYVNDTLIPGATSRLDTATKDGAYYVITTDSNGCTAVSDTLSISHTAVQSYAATDHSIIIWPNPATGYITVTCHDLIEGAIVITDVTGRVLVDQPLITKGAQQLSLSTFASGVYQYRITSGGIAIKSGKFVVSK